MIPLGGVRGAASLALFARRAYLKRLKAALGASLAQYLPAGETTGSTANDRSGNGLSGSYMGSYTQGVSGPGLPGDQGRAVNLARTGGINGYSAGLAGRFNGGGAGMVAAWFAASSAGVWTDGAGLNLLGFGTDTNNRVFVRVQGSADSATLQLYYAAGGVAVNVNTNPALTTRWLHVAMCWDKPGNLLSLYLNGAQQAVVGGLGTWAGALASNFAYYGANQALGGPFAGKLAHCVYADAQPGAAALRVVADQARGVVCFEGDSRTSARSWPFAAVEAAYPGGARAFGGHGVTTLASSGANYATIHARAAEVDARLVPGGRNILVHWAGVNSGALGTGIYDDQLSYLAARKAAGWKIVWCTEIDGNPANWHGSNWPALNAAMRANHSVADAFVDLGADARLQDYANASYFVDGIHLTAAGYAVVQGLVQAGLAVL